MHDIRTTIDAAGRVVFPKRLRDEIGLVAGQEVDIEVIGSELRLEPVTVEPEIVERNRRWVVAASAGRIAVEDVDRLRDAIRR